MTKEIEEKSRQEDVKGSKRRPFSQRRAEETFKSSDQLEWTQRTAYSALDFATRSSPAF